MTPDELNAEFNAILTRALRDLLPLQGDGTANIVDPDDSVETD